MEYITNEQFNQLCADNEALQIFMNMLNGVLTSEQINSIPSSLRWRINLIRYSSMIVIMFVICALFINLFNSTLYASSLYLLYITMPVVMTVIVLMSYMCILLYRLR